MCAVAFPPKTGDTIGLIIFPFSNRTIWIQLLSDFLKRFQYILGFGVPTKRSQSNIEDLFSPNSDFGTILGISSYSREIHGFLASVYDRVGNTELLNNRPFEQKSRGWYLFFKMSNFSSPYLLMQVLEVGDVLPPNVHYALNRMVAEPTKVVYRWDQLGPWTHCSKLCQGKAQNLPITN